MQESTHPEDGVPSASAGDASAGAKRAPSSGATGEPAVGNRGLGETELDTALQLLVERAQYITGATGTALALPQGEEMVCRASAGSSAPAVGARLQVRSGLTGESISRRQLLRCDNAETDPRVNLETCRALGVASIVVLPLLRSDGGVRGLFELFSDHAYAFEERDLIALERMADLTLTALDLAEDGPNAAGAGREAEKPAGSPTAKSAPVAAIAFSVPQDVALNIPANLPRNPEFVETEVLPGELPAILSLPSPMAPASIPEAMSRVQKCGSCGFPVSEGRTLCLDCEKNYIEKKDLEKRQREKEKGGIDQPIDQPKTGDEDQGTATGAPAPAQEEFVPAFLANAVPVKESWMANHVNLLAIVILILGIVVAVVVFR